MADEIRVNVVLDPAQVKAGSDDVVAAVQTMSADITAALSKVTTSSNAAGAAIRSGFSGIEGELRQMQQQMASLAGTVAQGSAAIVGALNQIPAAGNNAGNGLNRVGHAAAGVRREFLVLAHEASQGQWTRFGGSLLVLGERMDWLRYLTGPVGIGIGVIAGAVAAVGVAAIKGAAEISHLNDELILTGNMAGLTADRFMGMAQAIASANKDLTIAQSRGAVSAVAGTGAISSGAVQAVATAVAEIARLSGETAQKVANDFAKMDEGVYKWALENKEAKNLVSAADAEYARALEEQGKKEEAEVYIAGKISEQLHAVGNDLGILPGLWREVADAASEAWNAMMNVGRPDSLQTQIDKLKERKAALQDSGLGKNQLDALGGGVNLNQGDTAAGIDNQIAFLENEQKFKNMMADRDAQQAKSNREGKESSDRLRKDNEELKAKSLLQEKIAQYESDIAKSRANGGYVPSDSEQAAYKAYLAKRYSEHEPKAKSLSATGAGAVGRAEDTGELALLKDRLAQEEKLLQTAYKGNEISLAEYYRNRMKLVQEGMQAEIAVAQRGVANAEAAAPHAGNNPNAQQEAQAKIVTAKNRVALLNQQLDEQERNLTAEMEEQQSLQDRKIASLKEEQAVKRADANASQQQRIGAYMVSTGQMTNEQLLALDQKLENERYQVAMDGLQRRLQLPHQSLEQQEQINGQIEALEQQHQAKLTELAIQSATAQQKAQKTAMGDLQNDLETLSENLVLKPQQWRQSFMTFFTSLDSQLVKLSANALFGQLMGPGTGVGSSLNGVFGKLFGTASAASTQQIASANIMSASVPSMTVANMTVANSNSLSGGGSAGGLASLLSGLGSSGSFAGAFGFSDAAVTGSTSAVIGGAMADSSSTGLSALFGLAAYAQGTPYVPSTGLALLHQGEAVVPAVQNSPYASGGIGSITNNFVLPGNTDMRTQSQIAGMAGGAIQQAMRRNG